MQQQLPPRQNLVEPSRRPWHELLEAEEELEVVVDLLGMPGGQQLILIVSPSAQMYQPGQSAWVPTA